MEKTTPPNSCRHPNLFSTQPRITFFYWTEITSVPNSFVFQNLPGNQWLISKMNNCVLLFPKILANQRVLKMVFQTYPTLWPWGFFQTAKSNTIANPTSQKISINHSTTFTCLFYNRPRSKPNSIPTDVVAVITQSKLNFWPKAQYTSLRFDAVLQNHFFIISQPL